MTFYNVSLISILLLHFKPIGKGGIMKNLPLSQNYEVHKFVILFFIVFSLLFALTAAELTTKRATAVVEETINIAQFAYPASDSSGENIYTINCDGSVINKITNFSTGVGGIISSPTWSPDGQKIAFSLSGDIYIINLDGTNLATLTSGANPSWSPDGQKIAFQNDGGNPLTVYVIDTDGSHLQKIADTGWSGGTPDWSFDGKRLVFVKDEDLYTYNFETLALDQITNDPGWESQPKWSPVDLRIAYQYSNGSGTGDIYIFDAGASTKITNSFDIEENVFDWSPDGTKISYSLYYDTYVMNADGTNPTLLFKDIWARAWRPGIDGCPRLTLNYNTGAPGSHFAVSGANFPPNNSASITVNGHYLGTAPVDTWGAFQFSLDTTGAENGHYYVTTTVNPSRTAHFEVDDLAPLRPPTGNAQIVIVPPDIALTEFVFLPMILRE